MVKYLAINKCFFHKLTTIKPVIFDNDIKPINGSSLTNFPCANVCPMQIDLLCRLTYFFFMFSVI